MKRELKRQIKQDELRTGFDHAVAWVSAHRDEAKMTLGVVVVVGAIAAGFAYVRASRQREAEAAFAAAMETFKASVAAEIAPGAERPSGTVYATANEKFKKAAAAFDGVERGYPSLAVGSRARYYAALSRIELGEMADAEKALKEAATRKGDGGLDSALARLALADLHRRSGQIDKAAQDYRDFAADSSVPFPRDFALMNLGSMLEQARKLAEAEVAYRRVVDEFATGVYAPEARRRLAYLQTAIQG